MTPVEPTDSRLRFVSIEKAAELKEGIVYCYLNRWWVCHPEKGIIFYRPEGTHGGSPQCNTREDVTRDMASRLYPWAEVKLLPVVIQRVDPHDYI